MRFLLLGVLVAVVIGLLTLAFYPECSTGWFSQDGRVLTCGIPHKQA